MMDPIPPPQRLRDRWFATKVLMASTDTASISALDAELTACLGDTQVGWVVVPPCHCSGVTLRCVFDLTSVHPFPPGHCCMCVTWSHLQFALQVLASDDSQNGFAR